MPGFGTAGCPGCLGVCGFILGACPGLPGLILGAFPGLGVAICGVCEIFGAPPVDGLGTATLLGTDGVGGCLGAVVVTFGGVLPTLGLPFHQSLAFLIP